MPSIDPTAQFGSEPITPPPGIRLDTPEQEQTYRVALEFERFFVQQLTKDMQASSSMSGEEQEGSLAGYRDLAQDQLTQAVLDGGGLGLAGVLYGQLAEQAGIGGSDDAAAAGDDDAATTTRDPATASAAQVLS